MEIKGLHAILDMTKWWKGGCNDENKCWRQITIGAFFTPPRIGCYLEVNWIWDGKEVDTMIFQHVNWGTGGIDLLEPPKKCFFFGKSGYRGSIMGVEKGFHGIYSTWHHTRCVEKYCHRIRIKLLNCQAKWLKGDLPLWRWQCQKMSWE